MTRVLILVLALCVAGPMTGVAAQSTTAARPLHTTIIVTVPNDDTDLAIDGHWVQGRGPLRVYETSPLPAGTTHSVIIAATWKPNGYTTMTRTKTVSFRAGDRVTVDLTVHDPKDRVRVQYVPTPPDIAQEMVKLAGITPADVVFEPGCGDARITIAAIRAGARKGVCIDIDPELVDQARTKVAEAGLADRIEVRLGDALEIADLSTATVVFLYMGDHFNNLLRPSLCRELKVGSRVVSHRFLMGDWKPDTTVTITSAEGGDYELHLWTITEEVKRKLQGR